MQYRGSSFIQLLYLIHTHHIGRSDSLGGGGLAAPFVESTGGPPRNSLHPFHTRGGTESGAPHGQRPVDWGASPSFKAHWALGGVGAPPRHKLGGPPLRSIQMYHTRVGTASGAPHKHRPPDWGAYLKGNQLVSLACFP